MLGILRKRYRRGLPFSELYRKLSNPKLYLLAHGCIVPPAAALNSDINADMGQKF